MNWWIVRRETQDRVTLAVAKHGLKNDTSTGMNINAPTTYNQRINLSENAISA